MTIHEEKIVKWEQIKNHVEFAISVSKLTKIEKTISDGLLGFLSAIVDDLKILHKQSEAITVGQNGDEENLCPVCGTCRWEARGDREYCTLPTCGYSRVKTDK